MITANTKLTALDVLKECGVENPEEKFGNVRVRIGGIAGINKPSRLIKIQPEVTNLEVIVGTDVYDLELSEGNAESNKNVFEVTEHAKAVIEANGKEATKKAEKIQAVKALARKIMALEEAKEEFTPTKAEEKHVDAALDMVDGLKEAKNNPVRDTDRPVKKVKSS